MSTVSEKYVIRWLKTGTYQLIRRSDDEVIEQGSYSEILAYIQLEEMGLL